MGRLFSPDQQMVPCSAPNAYCDILMDLSDDISTPDFLSLRHDQQLEHAKEYSSILAEPRGSRLKARNKSARAAHGHGSISSRPAWAQACKSAAHPWRPLQWDHVNQNQLKAFESGLRNAHTYGQIPDKEAPQEGSRISWQDHQPLMAQLTEPVPDETNQQLMAKGQQDMMPHAVAAARNHSVRQRQVKLSDGPGPRHKSVKSCSQPWQPISCLKEFNASQAECRKPDSDVGLANCCHSASAYMPQTPAAAPTLPCSGARKQASSTRQQHADGTGYHYQQGPDASRAGRNSLDSKGTCKVSCDLPTAGRSGAGKSASPGKDSPDRLQNLSRHRVKGQPGYMAQAVGCTGGQSASKVQQQSRPVDSWRTASASPSLLGNWIRWEAGHGGDEAVSELLARNRNVATAAAVSSHPAKPLRQSCGGQQSAGATTQPQASNKRHVMPCSGHSTSLLLSPHTCSASHEAKCVQPLQPPAPAQQGLTQQPWKRSGGQQGGSGGTGEGGAAMAGRLPDMRYCLSSSEPAVGAGMWEEQTTRSWLRGAGLGVVQADETAPLLDNPLRNGLLLCDLAGALEGRIVWGVNRKPINLTNARSNVMAALGHLGMLTAQTCPRGLVHEVEHMLQGRQASIWGLLNHLRLTHPSAATLGNQLEGEQAADRTAMSSAEACKPDRCSGALVDATNDAEAGNASGCHMVSVSPHGSVRCSSPALRSPGQQQHRKRHLAAAPCPYHDHETLTVSIVRESGMYTPPEKAVSPQRSRRSASPAKQLQGDVKVGGYGYSGSDAYVRVVAVGPALTKHQHGASQGFNRQASQQQQQHASTPQRCPEPAAAAAAQGGRKSALAQLRLARRKQQQLTPADVQKQVADKMSSRNKQGAGAQWSSRKAQKEPHVCLSELDLVAWVRSKGLTELSPGMLLEESFADGRLLCRLVSLLERKTLSGVEWRTPSLAASRHNVAKAMAELKNKPSMSLHKLWQVAEIVKAEPGFVQGLLNDIARAYN